MPVLLPYGPLLDHGRAMLSRAPIITLRMAFPAAESIGWHVVGWKGRRASCRVVHCDDSSPALL
jgi:hypothetical protein